MMQTSVISPELSANSFETPSGRKYIVYPSLTTARFETLEKMMVEMENSTSLSGFRVEGQAAYDALNKGKVADAAVKLNNLLNGVSRIENGQPHPLLLICSLFICPTDERQDQWSEAEAAEKVQDWASVDIAFFLASAKRFLSRFMGDYATVFLNTLVEPERSETETQKSTPMTV